MTDPFALRSTVVMHAGCHLEGCAGCVLNFRLVPTTLVFPVVREMQGVTL